MDDGKNASHPQGALSLRMAGLFNSGSRLPLFRSLVLVFEQEGEEECQDEGEEGEDVPG
jgi:hypothetical protein